MNSEKIKKDFPIFQRKVYGKKLHYLDNAATTHMPKKVIEAITDYEQSHHSNVHRGIHALSAEATELFETARKKIAKFVNAKPEEIIFTKNATESLNLIARSYGDFFLKKGGGILLTQLEHHSNIVPWQMLSQRKKAKLSFAKMNKDYMIDEKDFGEKLKKAKIASFTGASNALGSILPAKKFTQMAKEHNAISIIDSSQLVPHAGIDVKKLDCDFTAFSGHKMLGPTGIGVLYGKAELLEQMPPFLGGGDMIREVFWNKSEWNDLPYKFEAGTPNISGAIGLGTAIDYLQKIGLENIRFHEKKLLKFALTKLSELPQMKLYGPKPENRTGIISFNLGDAHPHDVASLLDENGVAIRSGHHCAMPLMNLLKVPATNRASLYFYNNEEDIEVLETGLKHVAKIFKLE